MAAGLPLLKGTLDVLVLKALSWSAMHGFEITVWPEDHSGGQQHLRAGSVSLVQYARTVMASHDERDHELRFHLEERIAHFRSAIRLG